MVASILALVIWIAQFSRTEHFGLYEDDWAFIGQPMGWKWSMVAAWAVGSIQSWWIQGRPIGFAASAVGVFLANRIGGLEAVYVLTFFLHLVNAVIVFILVRQKLSAAPSLCAALGFALLPSDTSIPLLTNGIFTGLATFFLVFALWLYLRGSRAFAYAVSICSLLTFESAFLPFFAAPLLTKWDRRLGRRLLKHWAILLAIGGFVFWGRARKGEGKTAAVLGSGVLDTLHRILAATSLGPLTTIRLAITRPEFALRNMDRQVFIVFILSTIVLSGALYLLKTHISDTLDTWPLSFNIGRYSLHISASADPATAAAVRLGACGAAMLIMAYGLAISSDTYPPLIDAGRLSGCTHMAAATGFGLLVGMAASLLLDLAAEYRLQFWAAVLLACYCSGLGSFQYLVQRDFIKSWHIQQTFWRSVVKACPDLSNGTVIIYEDYSHPLRFVETNSWADPYVLREVYTFPKSWTNPPELFPVMPSWPAEVVERNGKLILPRPFGAWPDQQLRDASVILLKSDGDGLRRITGTITVHSHELQLKPLQNITGSQYEHGPLYRYLMEER